MQAGDFTSHVARLTVQDMLLALALAAAAPQSVDLAITNVTVVDVTSGDRAANQTVLVSGRRITARGPAATIRVPGGARRLDAGGRFLVPGLWDMHVHLTMAGRGSLGLFLANGVTGVREMGGNAVRVTAWRDSVARGLITGPRIVTAGLVVESGRWLRAVRQMSQSRNQPGLMAELDRRLAIDSAGDAVRIVDSLARTGADFIKIRNFPAAPAWFALARAARARGLRIAGHAPPPQMLAAVSDSGFASFEHPVIAAGPGGLVGGFDALDSAARRDLFARLARNGTAFDPTIVSTRVRLVPDSAVQRMVDDTAGTTRRAVRFASPDVRQTWRSQLALRGLDTPQDWTPIHRSTLRDVGEMAAAGVRILAGTDVPVLTLVPGFSLLDELEALVVDAGLTPLAALQAATVNPARVLGLADSLGGIGPGFVADLVLLDQDPVANIGAVRGVFAVVSGGRLHLRADLDRMLEEARR